MVSVIDVSSLYVSGATEEQQEVSTLIKQRVVSEESGLIEALRGVVATLASRQAKDDKVLILLPPYESGEGGKLRLLGSFERETREIDTTLFSDAFGERWNIVSRGVALAAGVDLDSKTARHIDDPVASDLKFGGGVGVIDIGHGRLTTAVRKRDVTKNLETYTGYREWLPQQALEPPFLETLHAIRKGCGLLSYDVLLCEKWNEFRLQQVKKEDHILLDHLQGAVLGTLLREFLLEHPGVGRFVVLGTEGGRCIESLKVPHHPAVIMMRTCFAQFPLIGRMHRQHMPILFDAPQESPYLRGGLALAKLP